MSSKSGGTSRKPFKPRRTHNRGGCSTCRRRHVKCDQARPQCTVCRDAGIHCGGFPSQIRWASMFTPTPAPSAASGPAPSDTVCPPMSQTPRVASNPVAEGRLSNESPAGHSAPPSRIDVNLQEEAVPFPTNDPDESIYATNSSTSELDLLFDSSSSLGWNDLFDPTMDFSLPLLENQTYDDPLGLLAHVASQPQDDTINSDLCSHSFPTDGCINGPMVHITPVPEPQPPPYTKIDITESGILEDAKVLLKYFRERLIPHFAPLPTTSKSPWEILNWGAAVITHAEMTFLKGINIKHASKANLFAILGCSARAIVKSESPIETISVRTGAQVLEYASRRAKSHMQESLKTETSGPNKAKYKDQLMAVFSLIALSTLTGNSVEARCYMIDAERLLRVRGLAKREVSRRARLLHHVYTWLRIIGESTFTLHDHHGSSLQATIEKIVQNSHGAPEPLSATKERTSMNEEHAQLDDFLRVESHATDSESDNDASKDQQTGLRDIHLADLREWPGTLYMDIYGIPELWLSLVSQTTRVGNILGLLEDTSLKVPQSFTNSLQRKINRLEHMICSFAAHYNTSRSPSPARENDSQTVASITVVPSASRAMIGAMSSALVIFFYRAIRKVHPWILQSHVKDVITALEDFDRAPGDDTITATPGTPWPAFIAGCEAVSPSSRDWFLAWLQKRSHQSASQSFAAARQVLQKVWARRDAASKASGKDSDHCTHHQRGEIYSWIDVLREDKAWLMLY